MGGEVACRKTGLGWSGLFCFLSRLIVLGQKRKAKKIKLCDEWSMARYELCTQTNPWDFIPKEGEVAQIFQ